MRRLFAPLPLLGAGTLALLSLWSPPAEASKNVFLQNHPDLDWYSIETEHFVVHYPKSRKTAEEGNDHYLTAEYTARKASKVAEEMYPRMCAEFNYFIKEQVHIVILDQSDELEGFTVPNWDWIEVSANPGSDIQRLRGRMDWLYDVLVHEYAHVVSLKAAASQAEGALYTSIGGLYSDGVRDVAAGGDWFISEGDPFFWTEGGAEYWSDESGYNWWTPNRDRTIRASVLEDRLLNYDEWTTRAQSLDWYDGERGYQQGYSFALYLRQRFGNDTYEQFGLEAARAWRLDWLGVIEDVTGVPGEELYEDWKAYVTEKYTKQYAGIKAKGEAAGTELKTAPDDWDFKDPEGRDAFYDLKWKRKPITNEKIAKMERERAKEASGTYSMVARYSDDGRWLGSQFRGQVAVSPVPEDDLYAFGTEAHNGTAFGAEHRSFGVPNNFMVGWDFVPGQDAMVVTAKEQSSYRNTWQRSTGLWVDLEGYDWNEIWYVPLDLAERKERTLRWQGQGLKKRGPLADLLMLPGARPVPNTARGSEPAMAPDGKKMVFVQYHDGTANLAVINLDGSEKRLLTNFNDGTWIQRCDWSPDGKEIACAVFRNYQQDLYIFDAASGAVRPINFDRWEDQDPHWAADGLIYFSSDPGGVLNIYSVDPKTQQVRQVTNVIGAAEAPSITPKGNLIYNAYTAHGYKTYGLARADFYQRDATADFNFVYDEATFKEYWAFREDLSMYEPRPYQNDLMAPAGVPILRFGNNALDDFGAQAGAQFLGSDLIENHSFWALGLVGGDSIVAGGYTNRAWYPDLDVGFQYGLYKFNYGYTLDDDQNANTATDRTNYEGRNSQYYAAVFGSASLPLNDQLSTRLSAGANEYGFKTASDSEFAAYKRALIGELDVTFTNIGFQSFSANPRGGRNIDLGYAHAYSDIVYEAQGGATVDDGELLDAYHYEQVDLRWTEQIPMPQWTWLPRFLKEAGRLRHTVQLDVQGGFISRNVDLNDELRAGGQHPAYIGSDSLRPSSLFAGYPPFSLSGETVVIGNLAYRFPIRRQLNWRMGPLYVYDITGQVQGTAGNLWSFAPPESPDAYYRDGYGDRVARNPADVKREIPFVDVAHKNGNYLLYDAGGEVRVSSSLSSGFGWNSFVRVAYGFQEIRGYGDVNGDDLSQTTENAVGDELSDETELPGVRVYVGIGTGW